MDNYRYREFGELKRAKSVLPWKLFSFSLIFSLVAFGVYFLLGQYYLPSLGDRLSQIRKETHDLVNQINAKDKQEMIIFWSQIKNIEKLLSQHIYPSKILAILEENILPDVALDGISFKEKNGYFDISGRVKNSELFAQQVYVLEKTKEFKKILVKRFENRMLNQQPVNEQTVQERDFEIEIYFMPELIKNF